MSDNRPFTLLDERYYNRLLSETLDAATIFAITEAKPSAAEAKPSAAEAKPSASVPDWNELEDWDHGFGGRVGGRLLFAGSQIAQQ
jgi:hypothetical protein